MSLLHTAPRVGHFIAQPESLHLEQSQLGEMEAFFLYLVTGTRDVNTSDRPWVVKRFTQRCVLSPVPNTHGPLINGLFLCLIFTEKQWGIIWRSEATKLSWSCTQKLHRNLTAMRKGESNVSSVIRCLKISKRLALLSVASILKRVLFYSGLNPIMFFKLRNAGWCAKLLWKVEWKILANLGSVCSVFVSVDQPGVVLPLLR